jgi:alkanesulfonate monooxygenase SsuD/methylene tetrahydromethanopterin reductase-like flavin-dependent oxidoreductase (luciferase family)
VVTRVSIGFKTSPQGVDWATLDALWGAAGAFDVFDAGWLNDHLTDPRQERAGASLEAISLAAALAHRVPGKRIGHAVLSNTFRHPAILAKAAAVLDQQTGGRFILGLGAGWHQGEHEAFGLTLPPIGERIDRLTSAVTVLRALFSAQAQRPEGVSLEDRFYPLRGATNMPGPTRPGGPPIWLGGQKRRGIALAARAADGWVAPGDRAGDVAYFRDRRDALLRAFEDAGRDPADFEFAAQVSAQGGANARHQAIGTSIEMTRAGATHVILALPTTDGPDAVRIVAREVAEPLRDQLAG